MAARGYGATAIVERLRQMPHCALIHPQRNTGPVTHMPQPTRQPGSR